MEKHLKVMPKMNNAGVVGLGAMGSGLARNLIAAGFETYGFDLSSDKLRQLAELGGKSCSTVQEVGRQSDAVFVMVMNGQQAHSVILGPEGLAASMTGGGAIILTATILPSEARALGEGLAGTGISFIDSPVSGGYPGAQNGSLALMSAAPIATIEKFRPFLDAVSKVVHHVGDEPGQGQSVKTCLQSLIGSIFSATYEASVLAAKAGVSGQALREVIASTGAGNGITDGSLENIMARKFSGTGSHINTMHKDLSIVMDVAREMGVPMHTASAAMQLFTAGRTAYPDGDNQAVTRVIETIVGTELKP